MHIENQINCIKIIFIKLLVDMESSCKNSCSVIQYYKGTETETNNAEITISSNFESQNAVEQELKEVSLMTIYTK